MCASGQRRFAELFLPKLINWTVKNLLKKFDHCRGNTLTMCEFHESTCNGFGDIWWTDNPIYFSSIDSIVFGRLHAFRGEFHLGRSFHSTEPLYLKLFLPYVIDLNDGASTFIFRRLCPVSLIGLIMWRDHYNSVFNSRYRWGMLHT